jgi:Mce-associated membrane protein
MAEHADSPEELIVQDGEAAVGQRRSRVQMLLAAGVIGVVSVGGVAGWMGYDAYATVHAQQEREMLLQVGREAAVNLATIDHSQAEADVQRLLDVATGAFHDDFKSRSASFVELVKKAQSKSEGTITESGLESTAGDQAQVLVAMNVKTTGAGAAEQEPRGWRLGLTVQMTAVSAKVYNVEFVP